MHVGLVVRVLSTSCPVFGFITTSLTVSSLSSDAHLNEAQVHTASDDVPMETALLLRYDTRCWFNVRSKADMNQPNLPHGTDN